MDGSHNRFVKPTYSTIKTLYHNYELEYNEDTAVWYAQHYTIELSTQEFITVLNLSELYNVAELEKLFYTIADIDFTIDYKGCVCKTLMWKSLVSIGFTEAKTKIKKTTTTSNR